MRTYHCYTPAFETEVMADSRKEALALAAEHYDEWICGDQDCGKIQIKDQRESFPVVMLQRGDLIEIGLNPKTAKRISDEEMEGLASRLSEALAGETFFNHLEILAAGILTRR